MKQIIQTILENIGHHSSAYATLASVGAVIAIYLAQKRSEKIKAARLIYQEIRRGQIIIKDFIKFGQYRFAYKIIPNNSWKENIHLFAKDFAIDEIDTITDLYSAGEYLDNLVQQISDITFRGEINSAIQNAKNSDPKPKKEIKSKEEITEAPQFVQIKAPWEARLELVTKQIDLIENTPIFSKLAKLAKYKG